MVDLRWKEREREKTGEGEERKGGGDKEIEE